MRNLLDLGSFKSYSNGTLEATLVSIVDGKFTQTQATAHYKIQSIPIILKKSFIAELIIYTYFSFEQFCFFSFYHNSGSIQLFSKFWHLYNPQDQRCQAS